MVKQVIGSLKKIEVSSKVDDQERVIHTLTVRLELVGGEESGIKGVEKIRDYINQPIRVDFDPIQLKVDFKN